MAPIFDGQESPYLDKRSGIYYLEEPPRHESSFYLCPGNKTKILLVADCYSDGVIKIYPGNGDRETLIYNLIGHNMPIQYVQISTDAKFIYSWSSDRIKITWETKTGKPILSEIDDFK